MVMESARRIGGAIFTMSTLLVLSHTSLFAAAPPPQDIADWCESIKGKEYWLRTDVIRIENLKATDATNVFPDGRVYHQGTISKGRQISAQTPLEFTTEARRKLGYDQKQNAATILSMNRGARVYVHDVEISAEEVRVQLTLKGSWYSSIKSTIRLKFEQGYSLEDVKRSFAVAFAQEEFEVKHADKTDTIQSGMTPDEVTHVLGYADTEISLADKVILVYGDLKLVFQDNKLVNAD